jgi:hypothetical protein
MKLSGKLCGGWRGFEQVYQVDSLVTEVKFFQESAIDMGYIIKEHGFSAMNIK